MAIIENGLFRGILGRQVFRVVNGQQRVSMLPESGTVKRTIATKLASNTFGMASSLGVAVKSTVSTRISHFKDGSLTNRLNTALIKTLNECRDPSTELYTFEKDSFIRLKGMEYNVYTKLDTLTTLRPEVDISDGQLTVEFPDLAIPKQLRFPMDTFRCRIGFYVSLFRLKDGKVGHTPDSQEVTIIKDKNVFPGQKLVFEVPDGCLCLVSMFMEYSIAGKNEWEPVNNKTFNPGCICGALITPGVYEEKKKRIWDEMPRF